MTTVNDLLFGPDGVGGNTLSQAMTKHHVELELIAVSGAAVDNPKVAGAVVDVLDVRLSSFVARGWHDYQQVQKAIDKTRREAPDRDEVGLARHTIKTKHPIAVEVDVGGVAKKVFECELQLEFDIEPVNLMVINGHIGPVTAQAGVKGTLRFGEVDLAERELRRIKIELREEQIAPPKRPRTTDGIDLR